MVPARFPFTKTDFLLYARGMATQPIDTAKLYALTAAGACSVTLTQGEKSITWEALEAGGQTSFIVPAGASVNISDSAAILSPLPANFKAALGAGTSSIGGESISTAGLDEQSACCITIHHGSWVTLPPETARCTLIPANVPGQARSMQLLLTPGVDWNAGWLTSTATIVWLYGEPVILSGHTYIIGLTQIAPDKILANLLATF